jgi:hypothetical protein
MPRFENMATTGVDLTQLSATGTAGPSQGSRPRWVGVGRSAVADGFTAGSDAAALALQGQDPKLVIVFCSQSYDLAELLRGIHQSAPGVPLVGCSTAGEISTNGPSDATVVVAALGGAGFQVSVASAAGVRGRLREAGAEVAGCIQGVEGSAHRVLLMLTDGLSGDQQELVRGAYSVLGAAVPLVGGCAGDDLNLQHTYQFHDSHVIEEGIVAVAIGSDAPIGIGVSHGWRKVGEPMLVTRSADNRVYTLDDRPALDVYLERLQAPADVRTDPDAFTRFALTHPLGLSRRSGQEVRFVKEAHFDDRSIGCIAGVPQGGQTWMMEGDEESVLQATDAACADAVAMLGEQGSIGFLAFDCIARRGVLGDEGIRREVSRIGANAGGAPVAGFYTLGEIARTHGVSGFHNQTLVILALS